MLFKLSFKNIKKSFKDYTIYFFTLILGIAIFYVFNALDSQTVLLDVTSSSYEIIQIMIDTLSAISVFVSFILGFLIIYASSFLIKRRNKEFGIYLTLGMSKRKISSLLFFETLTIGILSLIVGMILGIIASQFMSLFVANMFEANMTKFQFVFSKSACIKTIIYFSIMYLLVMIFNTVSVSKYKLIDLLQSHQKSQQIKLKNPWLCTIIFIISCLVLGYAYYLVTGGIQNFNFINELYLPILLGVITTFLIFWSLSGLLLRIFTSIKKIYFKNLNSFILRQFSSKINTTVFSMTVICLMLFVTICILSSSLSLKNASIKNIETLAPVDIQLYKYNTSNKPDANVAIKENLKQMDFDYQKYFKDTVEYAIYTTNITVKDTLGTSYEKIAQSYPKLLYQNQESFITLSDYNNLAKVFNLKTFDLNDNEYILIADFDGWIDIRNAGLKANTPLSIGGKQYYPKYQECQNGFIDISSGHVNYGIFIVPDQTISHLTKEKSYLVANYNTKSKDEKREIEQILIDKSQQLKDTTLNASTKISIYEASLGLGSLVTFIGLYLGIIFLISSAAILALKELSEASDNKERYNMLKKLGADQKMLNKALFRQIAIFFMFPLILAIIHSIFGIMFSNYILSNFGNEKLLDSILMTALFIIGIYGGYFIITYQCSKHIIFDK